MPIGLLHRLVDYLELQRVDHLHINPYHLNTPLEVTRVTRGLHRNFNLITLFLILQKPSLKLLITLLVRPVAIKLPNFSVLTQPVNRKLPFVQIYSYTHPHFALLLYRPKQSLCGGSLPLSYSTSQVIVCCGYSSSFSFTIS